MSFNGSGTFVINSAGQPVVANTVISATVFNTLTADLATGLSTCITKDGQTTVTANIPFGSNKITGLGAGTAATDSANLGQVQSTAAKLITVTGTDTISGAMSPALTAYTAGQLFYFIANAANTGAMTINIDGLGAKAITRDGATALIAGDVQSGEIIVICYDGTRFQMINAANSFGNTTINGTLTVTGDTALQANVSITSTLSVGGTFAVTGAATLGSTLSVTGKSDLPVVSTASMNAAVAVITTGTVTNLTSTSVSIASMNAGVALLTNATVTTLTATGASIASANIGNLQFTAASIASINAGVAVITNLTATSASIVSMNAGVALLTTATVTGLTATGASIASANAGNLQVTGASVASANVGVALITTGTVTTLTSTQASIGSANVGTAVVTGLTVTNASIASANAGTATLSGNLTLNGGTANGVLYLNASKVATSGSAITFDGTNFATTGTASATKLIPTGNVTAGNGMYLPTTNTLAFSTDGSERLRVTSAGLVGIGTTSPTHNLTVGSTAASNFVIALRGGVGGFFGWNDSANLTILQSPNTRALSFQVNSDTFGSGTEAIRITSAGNVGIGTSSPGAKLHVNVGTNENIRLSGGSGDSRIACLNDAASATVQFSIQGDPLLFRGTGGTERMRITSAGELLVGGTTSIDTTGWVGGTTQNLSVQGAGGGYITLFRNDTSVSSGNVIGGVGFYGNDTTSNTPTIHASVEARASGAHDPSDNPTDVVFQTTPDGTATIAEAGRITQAGSYVLKGGTTTAAAGVGIIFPATQVASANANSLDDYEEGTWTPIISDGTNNATAGANNGGSYTKIGNLVTVIAYVKTSSLGSVTGGIRITGLPFTAVNSVSGGGYASVSSGFGSDFAITANQVVGVNSVPNTSYLNVRLWDDVAGTTEMQATEWSADGQLTFSLTYRV